MERAVARRHARHRAGAPGRADRAVRRRRAGGEWSPPANEGSPIIAYDLQIGGGASAVQRVGDTTTFRWEGLHNGQEYTFMVRAVNAKGEGQFSSASAPEHPLRPPDAPAAPTGERGDKTINVRWSPPGNGGDPIIEYEVQILSTGAVNRTTGTSLQWSNLPNGQAQQFQVRARNRGRVGPVVGAVGGRRALRRARPGRRSVARPARRRRGDRVVGRARQPGLRDHRLHDQRPTRGSR